MNQAYVHNLSRSGIVQHSPQSFGRAPLFLLGILLIAIIPAPASAADLDIFNKGLLWEPEHRDLQAEVLQTTADGKPAVHMKYEVVDSESDEPINGEPVSKPRWGGFDSDLSGVDSSFTNLRFRAKSDSTFLFKIQVKDSNNVMHEAFIEYGAPGDWQEIDLPLEFESFKLHLSRENPELANQFTFPLTYIWIGIDVREEHPKSGEVTFSSIK